MLLQLASLITAIVGALAVPIAHNAPQPPLNLRGGAEELSELTAQSVFLVDVASGAILHTQNADEVRPLASITKLMTAMVLLDHIKDSPSGKGLSFDRQITFETRDRRNGDITRLIPGEEITVRDAWKIMLVGSSNDAAAFLTRTILGSEEAAVATMNARAKELGLRRLKFTDPTGLDVGNVGTAREVSALARVSLQYPEIREAVLQTSFQFAPKGKPARKVQATNQLLYRFRQGDIQLLGGKTGHIEASGYNLVFAVGNHAQELVGVILGAPDNEARFAEMKILLTWGFKRVPASQSLGD